MTTQGITALYIETRNYGATAAFWASLGYHAAFETEHGSGRWDNPDGGPYLFIAEQQDADLAMYPVLAVADSTAFAPSRDLDYAQGWTAQHWEAVEAVVRDPDGRRVSLQAPVPEGAAAPDMATHHAEKYGS